jgi:tyrosinase
MKTNLLADIPITRKDFLKGLGTLSGLSVIMLTGGCEELAAAIRNRPTRRRIRTGSTEAENMVNLYRNAVEQMKGLPTTDPRNWKNQATIHGWAPGAGPGGFNFCAHNNDHFFTWHRAYLHQFEVICRKLCNEKTFALPYWNWCRDRSVPAAFTVAGSALNHPRGALSISNAEYDEFFSPAVMDPILAEPNYTLFRSGIEGKPHNRAHTIIGRNQNTFSQGNSPEDPIFWPHHCMVDYCWYDWNINRNQNNPNDSVWMNTSWDHFYDADGNPRTINVVETLLMPLLAYQYENSQIGSAPLSTLVIRTKKEFNLIERHVKTGAPSFLELKERATIAQDTAIRMNQIFSDTTAISVSSFERAVVAEKPEERVFVEVVLAKYPRNSDFFVRVFVNKPDSADVSRESPYYAGSFAIFGTESDGRSDDQPRFTVELSDTIRRLRKEGLMSASDKVSVQVVPIPDEESQQLAQQAVEVRKIDLTVSRINIPNREN